MKKKEKTIALLIDAENISAKYIGLIIDEANKYGKINYRRVYGDWTTNLLQPWKSKSIEYGLTPIQQYTYTSGKNASDFTLIIDAMDILYSDKVDSFCIVSSDSDFTKLVTRLKEDDIYVFGMGESKTPISLVNSCETFSYLDKMISINEIEKQTKKETRKKSKNPNKSDESSITPIDTIICELNTIIDDNIDDDGWAYWGIVADLFQKKFPGFHPRNYGQNVRTINFLKQRIEFEFKKSKSSMYVKRRDINKKVA